MTNTNNTNADDGMLQQASHARLVELAYEHAEFIDREDPDVCYLRARRKAQELNGKEAFNANRDTSTTYLYPTCIFAFSDGTFCEVTYAFVRVMTEQEADEIIALYEGR